ncbi:unnamed protein product, partial [Meganyctiphanes norvegica]
RMVRELITQGAEGRVYEEEWLGRKVVIKQRFPKKYRHPELDSHISKERMKAEARALTRCRSFGIKTPAVYDVDFEKNEIIMEKIQNSITLRNYIYETSNNESPESKLNILAEKIGKVLANLHGNHIIHGDLTTSNMLLVQPYDASEIVVIDFGLSSVDERAEDKAVDLYVLERAILSTHPNTDKMVEVLLAEYAKAGGKAAQEVVKRLDEVRLRGRKKLCFG